MQKIDGPKGRNKYIVRTACVVLVGLVMGGSIAACSLVEEAQQQAEEAKKAVCQAAKDKCLEIADSDQDEVAACNLVYDECINGVDKIPTGDTNAEECPPGLEDDCACEVDSDCDNGYSCESKTCQPEAAPTTGNPEDSGNPETGGTGGSASASGTGGGSEGGAEQGNESGESGDTEDPGGDGTGICGLVMAAQMDPEYKSDPQCAWLNAPDQFPDVVFVVNCEGVEAGYGPNDKAIQDHCSWLDWIGDGVLDPQFDCAKWANDCGDQPPAEG